MKTLMIAIAIALTTAAMRPTEARANTSNLTCESHRAHHYMIFDQYFRLNAIDGSRAHFVHTIDDAVSSQIRSGEGDLVRSDADQFEYEFSIGGEPYGYFVYFKKLGTGHLRLHQSPYGFTLSHPLHPTLGIARGTTFQCRSPDSGLTL